METTVPTQNTVLKKALNKLLAVCYKNNYQHKGVETQTAMEYAEIALKQPKLKIKPCQGHSQLETYMEDILP